jgi:hypothetical protein
MTQGQLRQQRLSLADYMEAGLKTRKVREDQYYWIVAPVFSNEPYKACALGLALIGRNGSPRSVCATWKGSNDILMVKNAARLLGIPLSLANRVNGDHRSGKRAIDIISELRAA